MFRRSKLACAARYRAHARPVGPAPMMAMDETEKGSGGRGQSSGQAAALGTGAAEDADSHRTGRRGVEVMGR